MSLVSPGCPGCGIKSRPSSCQRGMMCMTSLPSGLSVALPVLMMMLVPWAPNPSKQAVAAKLAT